MGHPWEQRKLGSITTRILRKNKNLESELPLTISAQDGLVDQETFFNKRVAGKDLEKYLLIRNGEFAYNKSYSAGFPWGAVKRLEKYEKGVVSSLYILFSAVENKVDPIFLETYFETDRWYDEMRIRAAEGARNHGLLNIPASDFFDINIKLPSLDEQVMVGEFFVNLNHLITLHQRQLEELKNLKSGLLQKMFPKTGKQIPDIRFPGFTEPWEQRKLRNISELITGGTPNTKRDDYWSPPEIPWMASGEINKKLINQPSRYISKLGFENSSSKWVPKNSVLIALAGQGKTRGMCAYTTIPITINQSLAAVVPNSLVNPKFLLYDLERRYEDLRAMSSGDVTRGGLNKALLADLTVNLPSLKEQTRIGEIFRDLEDLITLHQR